MPDLASAGDGVLDALARLDHVIDPSPVDPTPLEAPCDDALVGWVSATRLAQESVARSLARRCSDDLGTPHLAVGAACALQHYTGRLATTVLGVWAQTGRALSMEPTQWYAALDAAAHTRRVGLLAPVADGRQAALAEVLDQLRRHVRPLVDAACAVGSITPRLAWGSLATS